MRTKNIATLSAVAFGLTAALMGGTALSQTTTPAPAEDPILQQDQTEAQTEGQTEADTMAPDTGVAEDADPTAPDTGVAEDADPMAPDTGVAEDADPMAPDTGVAEDADPMAPDTGVAGDAGITPDTGMAADGGLPRRSVADSAEPYTGDVLAGITADELIGMDVVDATGENVGSVTDLLLGDNDQVDHAIIDVGGFLGFGAKSVAIPLDELAIAEGDGEVVVNTTRDQLDAMPEWSRSDEGWMSN
jgi:sporulation protein YlmC with PRC-barrel domain